jgi:hypothetical protein
MLVVVFYTGPGDFANWMGQQLRAHHERPQRAVSIFDVLQFIFFAPWLILGGGILALVMRPSGKGPVTIDLSGRGGQKPASSPCRPTPG